MLFVQHVKGDLFVVWAFLTEDIGSFLFLLQSIRFFLLPEETEKVSNKDKREKTSVKERLSYRERGDERVSYHCEAGLPRDKKP